MFEETYTMEKTDPEIFQAIEQERQRQEDHVELIASENNASPAVLAAQGSVLTNKYAEGYPGKRYYGGCQYVDIVEDLARQRVQELYGAEFSNVQPHCGAGANMAVFFATLKPGDTVLGMSLDAGGHLTHGARVNFSGKHFNAVCYGLEPDSEDINYDEVERLADEHRPKLIICGASAFSRKIRWDRFREIADQVGASVMADMAHYSGLIAAGLYPSPVNVAHYVTSTTHKSLRGPRGGFVLSSSDLGKAINSAVFPGLQGGPLMHVIAAKAIAFKEAMSDSFKEYQEQVLKNAVVLAKTLTDGGIRIVSGGTDSHVFLADLRSKKITGRQAEEALDKAHITLNKNAVPNDPQPPMETSGVRIGSPAATTRGFKEAECERLGELIISVLNDTSDANLKKVAGAVTDLCRQFPIYRRD